MLFNSAAYGTSADSSKLIFMDKELPLECMLPPCGPVANDNLAPLLGDPVKCGWVEIDLHWVHLESVMQLILGTETTEKSTDRLRCVCGFTQDPSTIAQSDSILGDLCLIGQLMLALVQVDNEIALAVVRVTSIWAGVTQSHVKSISLDHLNKPDVVLTGQILELKFQDGVWYWNR
jgi:hypothetical protein